MAKIFVNNYSPIPDAWAELPNPPLDEALNAGPAALGAGGGDVVIVDTVGEGLVIAIPVEYRP